MTSYPDDSIIVDILLDRLPHILVRVYMRPQGAADYTHAVDDDRAAIQKMKRRVHGANAQDAVVDLERGERRIPAETRTQHTR